VTTIVHQTGNTVYDSAVVSTTAQDAPPITGTVTYTLYNTNGTAGTDDDTVVGSPDTVTIANGLVPDSSSIGPLAPGSYYFIASYGGGGIYKSALGDAEPFTVDPVVDPNSAVTIEVHKFQDNNGDGVWNGTDADIAWNFTITVGAYTFDVTTGTA